MRSGTTLSRVQIPPAPSLWGRSSVGRACVSAKFVVPAGRSTSSELEIEIDSGPNACRGYFLTEKQNLGRRLSAPIDKQNENGMGECRTGLHGQKEGSKGLEGSTPSLRKQSFISPKVVTR
jgi:hypothetical protein